MEKIEAVNKNLIEIKKSKFIGLIYNVDSDEQIKCILNFLAHEYKKATHICYAYILKNPNREKCSDAGEPCGTAGKPILTIMKRNNLYNSLVVVVRYFGGVKLGAGGLIRAYSKTANDIVMQKGEWKLGIITKVEVQKNNKNKVNIFIDNEFFRGASLETILKYGIKAGVELEEKKLEEICLESEKILAVGKASNYVSSSIKSRKQVRDYLLKKGYDEEVIKYTLEKLLEYGYINDNYFANAYVETYKNKFGKLKLKQNLIQKGISESIVETTLNEIDNQEKEIYNIARKYLKNKDINYDNVQKLGRFLYGRGYTFDEIKLVQNKISKEKNIDFEKLEEN